MEEEIKKEMENILQKRLEFVVVVFQRIFEIYLVDVYIECRYIIILDLILILRDWVGFYKVGWMNIRDYYYYEWV